MKEIKGTECQLSIPAYEPLASNFLGLFMKAGENKVALSACHLYSLQASLEYMQKSCSRGSTPKFKPSRRHLDNKLTDLELEIIQLSQLITSGKSLQDKEMESKFAICFTSGYPGTMNLEFLIRSVGLSYLLIPYLSPIS